MAQDVGKLMVHVGADTKDAEQGLQRVHASFKDAALGGAGFAAGMQVVNQGMHLLESGLTSTISVAANFQHSIAQVGAVAGATKDQLGQIAEAAKRIGFETTFTATEASQAMEILAANGVSLTDILGGAADSAVALAAAGGTTLATAADTVSTAMVAWGASVAETEDYVNRLAGAANVSRFGVEDMSQAVAQGGGVAASAGVSFADFAASIAGTAASFSSGADAGTSFKTFIQRLAAPTADAAEAMKHLGISAYDSQGNMRPMGEIVEQLHGSLGRMTEAERTNAASIIFGSDAMRTALGLAGMTREEFDKLEQTMGNTKAADVAAQRMTAFDKAMGEFKGSIENLQIAIGEKLLPVLADLATWASTAIPAFADWLKNISAEPIKLLGDAFGKTKDAAVAFFGWMSEHEGVTKALAIGIAVVTAEMIAFAAASAIAAAVNPFTAIILATELLAAGVAYLVINWDDLTQRFPALGVAADGVTTSFDALMSAFDWAADAIERVNGILDQTGHKWEILSLAFGPIGLLVTELIIHFGDLVDAIGSLRDAWDELSSYSFSDLFGDLRSVLEDLWGWITNIASDWYDAGYDAGAALVNGMEDGAWAIWESAKDGFLDIVDPRNWDVPGRSPLIDAFEHTGNDAGEALVNGIADGMEGISSAPAVQAITGYIGDLSQCIDNGAELVQQAANRLRDIVGNMLGGDFGDGTPPSGPFLNPDGSPMTPEQMAALNKKNTPKPKPVSGIFGGGGGGGGGGLKEAAKTAIQEFTDAINDGIAHSNLEKTFGDLGTKLMETFEDSVKNPKSAAKLPDLISQLVAEAKDAGVPNADALGQALGDAIASGLAGGGAASVETALHGLTDAITAAGQLTWASFGQAAAKIREEDALGSAGKSVMDSLHKALTDGGAKNIQALAGTVTKLQEQLNSKLPEGQAAYLGTSLMMALQNAINTGSPEAIAALKGTLSQVNDVLSGGAIDIRSGLELTSAAVADLGKALGVSANVIRDHVNIITDFHLDKLAKNMPKSVKEAVSKALSELDSGKIQLPRAMLDIGNALGVQMDVVDGIVKVKAKKIGEFVQNIATDVGESTPVLIGTAQTAMDQMIAALDTNLKSGTALTGTDIDALIERIRSAIDTAPLDVVAKGKALATLQGLIDGFHQNGSLANQSLMDILTGLKTAIETGSPGVESSAVTFMQKVVSALTSNLQTGKQLTSSELTSLLTTLQEQVAGADLPEAMKALADGTIAAWLKGIQEGGSVANAELMALIKKLIDAATAGAKDINDALGGHGGGGSGGHGPGGSGGGGGPSGTPFGYENSTFHWDGATLYVTGPGGVSQVVPIINNGIPYQWVDQFGNTYGGPSINPNTGAVIEPTTIHITSGAGTPPRLYATGTPYVPSDGLAYLHRGEAVLTKEQNNNRSGGGGQIVFAPQITAIDAEGVRAVLPTLAREFQSYLKDRGLAGFGL